MKLGFHGATTMPSDLQTDVVASAHATSSQGKGCSFQSPISLL